jgi:glycosyltransferase involved in cell wall biosynthesis/ribosomal protein S18 acetylase RimI-like enzyme
MGHRHRTAAAVKLAWFTPLGARSAIAEFSVHVTAALAEQVHVEIWAVDADARSHETPLVVHDARDAAASPRALDRFDAVVYNLGNFARYHGAIVETSRLRPGTVVLHDRTYHHLFREYWRERSHDARFAAVLAESYGDAGRDYALTAASPGPWDDEAAAAFSFLEEAVGNAEGVVVHSRSQAALVHAAWAGPLSTLFLPSYPSDWDAIAHRDERHGPRALLLTIGDVNPNKQIHLVLDALRRNEELARRVRYVVAGSYDGASRYFAQLQSLAESLDVDFRGYVSDAEFAALARQTDVFVNLRYPNSEGSSASLMRQLPYGKPVLAYSSGVYGEMPKGTLALVETLEPDAIATAITRLLDTPALAETIGERGRGWAEAHAPELYARRLLSFIESEVRPHRPLLGLADDVAVLLAEFGADRRLSVVDRLAEELATLAPVRQQFRRLTDDDVDDLAALFEANDLPAITETFDPFPLTRESAEDLLRRHRLDRFYGAFVDGKLSAFSMLRGWDEGYEVPSFGIFVDADSHGRGIGAALTRWTVEAARAAGAPRVRLSVYGRNERALSLYERIGFTVRSCEVVDRRDGREERIVMEKSFADER